MLTYISRHLVIHIVKYLMPGLNIATRLSDELYNVVYLFLATRGSSSVAHIGLIDHELPARNVLRAMSLQASALEDFHSIAHHGSLVMLID